MAIVTNLLLFHQWSIRKLLYKKIIQLCCSFFENSMPTLSTRDISHSTSYSPELSQLCWDQWWDAHLFSYFSSPWPASISIRTGCSPSCRKPLYTNLVVLMQGVAWSHEIFHPWLTVLIRLSFSEQFSSPSEKHRLFCLKANGNRSLLINSAASIPFGDCYFSEHFGQLHFGKSYIILLTSLYFMSMALLIL